MYKKEYIRRGPKVGKNGRRSRKKGILIAIPIDNKISIGWSLCHKIEPKGFDSKFGTQLAVGRARKWIDNPPSLYRIPDSIKDDLYTFINKVERYYKDKEFTDWIKDWIDMYNYSILGV